MFQLPDPRNNSLLHPMIRTNDAARKGGVVSLGDQITAMQNREARRKNLYWRLDNPERSAPVRWFRPEPKASNQYAPHMATTAMRDRRLTPQAKALLVVLRARCGNGMRTETCKTTLAHIMGVCSRSIGRYVAELIRFGYVETKARRGEGGLYTGLVVTITEKVLPCFRKLPWLSGWLAQNSPENGGNPDRTELSYTNHSHKESSFKTADRPERRLR